MSAATYSQALHDETESVCLSQFYPTARQFDIQIIRKPNVFLPDEWTRVFAIGLERVVMEVMQLEYSYSSVIEAGIGTGINMAGILTMRPDSLYTGVDICDDAITSSRILAERYKWNAHIYKSDLLNDIPAHTLTGATHVIACIPQVPAEFDLSKGDRSAHYYNPKGSKWDVFGLGLNDALLNQTRDQTPQARVTLNLSGRPGLSRLCSLFSQHGYKASVVHEQMVSQHSGTSLASLAQLEDSGHEPFEFYADADGKTHLSATQAEEKRHDHEPVFHKVYVLSAPALK